MANDKLSDYISYNINVTLVGLTRHILSIEHYTGITRVLPSRYYPVLCQFVTSYWTQYQYEMKSLSP
jgi:hypothetical protein